MSPSYLNSSVFFLTTCFLLFTGFSCNILLTNIYIDLLLLALVFLKNFSTFNKRYSKFIMCYNFNYRLVLDLYILFQSFRAVLITQKLGSNFKYQLHCIMACVIIITFNRFLNLKWLINLSSFIYSKLAYLAIKTCSKSSWGLPINKCNLVKFFPSLFFIKFLVSIFKTIIDFILRNFINVLLNCKYIFNIFKNEFLVLCIVYTIFTNVTNLCNIFSIFYDYLNFCYFTIFGSIKFSVENFITSTLYFTKSVIYLRDIMVSTKELFQIRLTLISNSSDCENMIALFVFSFILLFLLLLHKRHLRLKACLSTIFSFFSISHFSSKKLLSLFPENTRKNISTSEFFTNKFAKASNFASMVFVNRQLKLFCFPSLRYRNNKTCF